MLITASNVSKSFDGIENIIENINLGISFGDRIGIVGVNGSGKSTLLNILSGNDKKFGGVVTIARSSRIGILEQIINFSSEDTLMSECKKAFRETLELQSKIKEIEKKLEMDLSQDEQEEAHLEYSHYLSLLEESNGYNIEYKIEKVLAGLGFPESFFNRKMITLSGGERRRAILSRILLEDTNVLMLDEPTNHLDIPAIDWVSDFINSYYGAVVVISHDKKFLNRVTNKIFEIELGKGTLYKGNFDSYLQQKERLIERQVKEYEAQQDYINRTEDFIRRYKAGQRARQAKGRQKQLENINIVERPIFLRRDISVKDLLKPERSGNEVAVLEDSNLGYDEKVIVKKANVKIYRSDKVVIVGNNGIGKTTLIKALTGENKPISGIAKTGYNVNYIYFTQDTSDLHLESTIIDYINHIRPDLKEGQIRNLLAKFYFTGDKVFEDTSILSGGEKTRLAILSFILKNANLLLLDEPTNHLDLFTIDSLGSILKDYPGTIIAVSHDRDFIDMFAEKIILMHSDGITMLNGNFSDNSDFILEKLSEGRLSNKHYKIQKSKNQQIEEDKEKQQTKKKKNLNTFKINQVEQVISELEEKLEMLRGKLINQNVVSNYLLLQETQAEIEKTEQILKEKLDEWEELHL
jgi:ATP-binding cassette subfamily F protein 3